MKKKIKINQLSSEIAKSLQFFSDDVVECSKESVDEVAKEALKIGKDNAPVSNRKTKGTYKRSLSNTVVYESGTEKRRKIHAKGKQAALTHLLERGHALRNGGRSKAIPHFKYADEYIDKNLEKRFISKVKKLT